MNEKYSINITYTDGRTDHYDSVINVDDDFSESFVLIRREPGDGPDYGNVMINKSQIKKIIF